MFFNLLRRIYIYYYVMLVLICYSLEVYITYFIIKTASYSKFVIFFLFRKANLLQPRGIDLLTSFEVLL